jgi:hypothetical protein
VCKNTFSNFKVLLDSEFLKDFSTYIQFFKMVVTKRKVDETIKDDETKSDITQEKKPRLEGQALLELRQRLRQRKKMFKLMPDFRLKPIGLDARLELASDLRKRLTMKDLQNLLLYSILGTRAPVEPSRLVLK